MFVTLFHLHFLCSLSYGWIAIVRESSFLQLFLKSDHVAFWRSWFLWNAKRANRRTRQGFLFQNHVGELLVTTKYIQNTSGSIDSCSSTVRFELMNWFIFFWTMLYEMCSFHLASFYVPKSLAPLISAVVWKLIWFINASTSFHSNIIKSGSALFSWWMTFDFKMSEDMCTLAKISWVNLRTLLFQKKYSLRNTFPGQFSVLGRWTTLNYGDVSARLFTLQWKSVLYCNHHF